MDKLALISKKIIPVDELAPHLAYWHFKGNKIVFTNGCFDIIHRGHIEYLAKAASLGDTLFIGLNTDASVKKLKGNDRPYQDEASRALILASFSFVSAVVLFGEDTPYEMIKMVQSDILVKGSDYKKEDIVGKNIVEAKGGEVVIIDYVDGYSTSSIIKKISR